MQLEASGGDLNHRTRNREIPATLQVSMQDQERSDCSSHAAAKQRGADCLPSPLQKMHGENWGRFHHRPSCVSLPCQLRDQSLQSELTRRTGRADGDVGSATRTIGIRNNKAEYGPGVY